MKKDSDHFGKQIRNKKKYDINTVEDDVEYIKSKNDVKRVKK